MEYFIKLSTVFVIFISLIVLIKCEDIDNGTFKENGSSRREDKKKVTKSAPNLSVPHQGEDPHLTTTNINPEPSEGGKLSPTVKEIFNHNHNSIENESTEVNKEVPLPIIWYKQWTPNEVHSGMVKNSIDLNEAISYNDSPILHALNHMHSVSSLPAVYPTYFNNMIPYQKRINYNLDGLNPQNVFMSHARPVRSSEEEWWAQLSHDAVMENILPTMPFPYFRSASLPSYYQMPYAQFHDARMMAVFPNGKISDSAIPLLFTCASQITRGTVVSENPSHGDVLNPGPVAPVTYKKYEHTDNGKEEVTASFDHGHIRGNDNANLDSTFRQK